MSQSERGHPARLSAQREPAPLKHSVLDPDYLLVAGDSPSTKSVEKFVEIGLASRANFCFCNTSSKLHSPAAFGDFLFDQSLAQMKQS
jgi:hypothetical protein